LKLQTIILGASGYGGGELLRWLSQHPNVASIRGTAQRHAGEAFHAMHPNLRKLVEGTFETEIAWSELKGEEPIVVFSALPHRALRQQLETLEAAWEKADLAHRITLIDLSTDFRWKEPFVYGLSEWKPERMRGAKRIGNPGCFASALQLGMLPLATLKPTFIAVSALTGSSGSGAVPNDRAHHPTRANEVLPYKVLNHQHEDEVLKTLSVEGWSPQLAFTPHSIPLVRGIFATLQFQLPPGLDESALRELYAHCYRDAFFVRLVEGPPRVAAVAGSAFADIGLSARNGMASVMVAIDNLGKGMASQAVQNMNLALGLPEWTGLRAAGCYPH
jgi:LysW-gamma-L-alpha-aminoadipyl-6-phosphate/LysW-L-glutamyl-5-phosphate reductase